MSLLLSSVLNIIESSEKEYAVEGRPISPKPSTSGASATTPRGDKNAFKKFKAVQKQHGSLTYICEMGDGSEKRFSRAEAYSRWSNQVLEFLKGIVSRMLKEGESFPKDPLH
ncbi:hypothetical protein GCK72_012585 [Caenorhabditis remanei]|uniref:Uncharacterized protein n=1 Tax=Caenorhabditis remanei TaxID=31234 RepID=A0A6A5GNZ4_CAERE|nr:hypothetical protein GCK72_012585 [Caenorhabditis remanei]KAF1756132.1 hypothetical protein GCK72_012585 [Caenorhabditis remanei]